MKANTLSIVAAPSRAAGTHEQTAVNTLKILLDFDGVLFNSAFEAFTVCNRTVAGRAGYRDDVTFDEFLDFRSIVTDAWQYNLLYLQRGDDKIPLLLAGVEPDANDWAFSREFFAARAEMMNDAEWPKIMSPYEFFFMIRPLLIEFPHIFAILSTRNSASIKQTMAYFDADVVPIFGQEDIRRLGSKLLVATDQGWLKRGNALVVYIDDMNAHLEPFSGRVHLPLHADWGYDRSHNGSLGQHQIFAIVSALMQLTNNSG